MHYYYFKPTTEPKLSKINQKFSKTKHKANKKANVVDVMVTLKKLPKAHFLF